MRNINSPAMVVALIIPRSGRSKRDQGNPQAMYLRITERHGLVQQATRPTCRSCGGSPSAPTWCSDGYAYQTEYRRGGATKGRNTPTAWASAHAVGNFRNYLSLYLLRCTL